MQAHFSQKPSFVRNAELASSDESQNSSIGGRGELKFKHWNSSNGKEVNELVINILHDP